MPKNYATDPCLHTRKGNLVTSEVQAIHGRASIDYEVGDRIWAGDDFRNGPVTGRMSLCEVVAVLRRDTYRVGSYYDEDSAPKGLPETIPGVAGGAVEMSRATYRVRVIHTEPAPGHGSKDGPALWPALDLPA